VDLWIKRHLVKDRGVAQGAEQLAGEYRPKVYELLCPIVECHAKCKWRDFPKRANAIYCVPHTYSLQWCDRQRWLARLQTSPIFDKFFLMQFSPRFNEPTLPSRQTARYQLYGIQADHGHVVLVVCMKMSQMVRPTDLGIHADDNPEESA
jgi:hypothetical protein